MNNIAYVLILSSLLYSGRLLGQDYALTISFSESPLLEVLQEIENQADVHFYYLEEDIDSVFVSAQYQEANLPEVLDGLLEGTPIYHYLKGGEVYLSKNVMVIDDLAIASSNQRQRQGVQTGMVFTREYLDLDEQLDDLESKVFEIGVRKDQKAGANSTVAGYIHEAGTGEPIVGAIIYTEDFSVSATTDPSGFYAISLESGAHMIYIQYNGFKTMQRNLVVYSDGHLNIEMDEHVITLDEVLVESDRDENVNNAIMGVSKINIAETRNVPVVLGERDVLKLATTMAGVQTLGEGSSGYNVRGGKSDQNLIMLNEVPVYNASHFMGFFTSFNSDALEGLDIYKSNIPVKYGGRLSSVFDISIMKASQTEFHGVGGISPVTSRLTLEIPVLKNTSGLMISGRTTYSNWILKNIKNANFNQNRISFQDMVLRYDHHMGPKDDLEITGYLSTDNYRLKSDSLFSYSDFSFSNSNGSINWTHKFHEGLIGSFGVWHSDYGYELTFKESAPNSFRQDFGIRELNLTAGFDNYMGDHHHLSFGLGNKFYTINPGTVSPLQEASTINSTIVQQEKAIEGNLYFSDSYTVNNKLLVDFGLRYSLFSALGPRLSYSYVDGLPLNTDSRTDTLAFSNGEWVKLYHGLEPRLSARYLITSKTSIKASYNRNRQYLHTMSNSASLSPTDIWRVSSDHILPQISDQVSLGCYQNLFGDKLEVSLEVYHKWLQNLMDFKVGSDFLLNENVETVVLQGPGKSFGLELSVKKSGKLNGWVNYTYARTFLKLDGRFSEERVNDGRSFPTNYDKPHVINAVVNWKITKRLSASYNFNYSSGRPVTFPVGSYTFKDVQMISYSDRNDYRIPDYMRMDIGINLEEGHSKLKRVHTSWSFSIYNVLGRDNAYSIFFDVEGQEVRGHKLVVFGSAIPTVTYNFKF
ncbi:TonB-dependent receptor [Marinoscillum sp. MHG1-6]|uniref:TonB-dependent receptor n=1 Tax=Marinoscillum sp. MHG1-6 TaxID=2959627 RepID=UPI0021585691|nr:TonB-dependent receptor [Marinoscillum sp. MHG1-6]